jgi:hypothetical protein
VAEIDNKDNVQVKANRRGNPNWKKGMASPNPKGNTHSKDIAGLIDALEDKSKRAGFKDFNSLVAARAIQYKEVLIAVMKKVYPEQSAQPDTNIYIKIWNGAIDKSNKIDQSGRLINA